jgi:hypothetical protein
MNRSHLLLPINDTKPLRLHTRKLKIAASDPLVKDKLLLLKTTLSAFFAFALDSAA